MWKRHWRRQEHAVPLSTKLHHLAGGRTPHLNGCGACCQQTPRPPRRSAPLNKSTAQPHAHWSHKGCVPCNGASTSHPASSARFTVPERCQSSPHVIECSRRLRAIRPRPWRLCSSNMAGSVGSDHRSPGAEVPLRKLQLRFSDYAAKPCVERATDCCARREPTGEPHQGPLPRLLHPAAQSAGAAAPAVERCCNPLVRSIVTVRAVS
eukprot:scaffold2419_cov114-Isochrysis_galbana.AAC.10